MTKAYHKPNIVSLKLTDKQNGLTRVTFDRDVTDRYGFAMVKIKAGGGYYFYATDELKAYSIIQAKINNEEIT